MWSFQRHVGPFVLQSFKGIQRSHVVNIVNDAGV